MKYLKMTKIKATLIDATHLRKQKSYAERMNVLKTH